MIFGIFRIKVYGVDEFDGREESAIESVNYFFFIENVDVFGAMGDDDDIISSIITIIISDVVYIFILECINFVI